MGEIECRRPLPEPGPIERRVILGGADSDLHRLIGAAIRADGYDVIELTDRSGRQPWSASERGDFLCAQAMSPQGRTWALTGFVLRDGAGDADVHPHVLRVGRERDIDCAAGERCPDDRDTCTAQRIQRALSAT